MPLSPDQPDRPRTASEAAAIREDLEELVKTPGWARFINHVRSRYVGEGYAQAINQALQSGNPQAPHIVNGVAQEILRVVNYPFLMIRDLQGDTE